MKALFSTAAAAIALAAASGPASAVPISNGNESANRCFVAASLERANASSIAHCSTALHREVTTGGEDRVATLVNRGILLMLEENSAGAVRDFNAALALDPLQPEAWLGKAVQSWKAGDDRNALTFANKALRLRTEKPEVAYLIRGLAQEGLGNVSAAYADLQNARALAPGWAEPAEQLKRYRVVRR